MQAPPLPRRKRFPVLTYSLLLVGILTFTLAPMGSVIIASVIADHYGCVLNEGGPNACVIGGVDRGQILVTMFVLGWLMLITLPLGALALFSWLSALIPHLILWWRQQRDFAAS